MPEYDTTLALHVPLYRVSLTCNTPCQAACACPCPSRRVAISVAPCTSAEAGFNGANGKRTDSHRLYVTATLPGAADGGGNPLACPDAHQRNIRVLVDWWARFNDPAPAQLIGLAHRHG